MLENCFSNICGPTRGCHTHYQGSLSTHAPIDIDDIIYILAANKADTEPRKTTYLVHINTSEPDRIERKKEKGDRMNSWLSGVVVETQPGRSVRSKIITSLACRLLTDTKLIKQ